MFLKTFINDIIYVYYVSSENDLVTIMIQKKSENKFENVGSLI